MPKSILREIRQKDKFKFYSPIKIVYNQKDHDYTKKNFTNVELKIIRQFQKKRDYLFKDTGFYKHRSRSISLMEKYDKTMKISKTEVTLNTQKRIPSIRRFQTP